MSAASRSTSLRARPFPLVSLGAISRGQELRPPGKGATRSQCGDGNRARRVTNCQARGRGAGGMRLGDAKIAKEEGGVLGAATTQAPDHVVTTRLGTVPSSWVAPGASQSGPTQLGVVCAGADTSGGDWELLRSSARMRSRGYAAKVTGDRSRFPAQNEWGDRGPRPETAQKRRAGPDGHEEPGRRGRRHRETEGHRGAGRGAVAGGLHPRTGGLRYRASRSPKSSGS